MEEQLMNVRTVQEALGFAVDALQHDGRKVKRHILKSQKDIEVNLFSFPLDIQISQFPCPPCFAYISRGFKVSLMLPWPPMLRLGKRNRT